MNDSNSLAHTKWNCKMCIRDSSGLNYYNLGYQTGEMAVQVLEGADPASMPVQSQNQYDYVVNEEMLSALGMELPQSLLEKMGDAA